MELCMPQEPPVNNSTKPAADVFNRGSLQLAADLIRTHNPQLAMTIRNILAGTPIGENNTRSAADYFKVGVDSFQVRAIVEALAKQRHAAQLANENPGLVVVTNTLIADWTALANKMIAELPESQRPNE